MVTIKTRLPIPSLRPYVKMYFWGKDEESPLVQRIVPNGEMGLCFYLNHPVIYDGIGERRSCLSGQSLHYHDIVSDGSVEIVGAHFTTLGAHVFFSSPLKLFFGQIVPLADIADPRLHQLEEEVMLASDYEICWDLMEAFFLERLCHSDFDALTFRRLQRAIAYGQRHTSDAQICQVASEACLSERHLNRVFSDVVGLSPKEYLRLQRYHKTLRDLKKSQNSNSPESLTSIAWTNGYCDFSHLYSDFRKICGYSPSRLLKESDHEEDAVGWRI